MGQAKLRRSLTPPTVYHHTSTLRTNLLWMSGVIELEGRGTSAYHPKLGKIEQRASIRRDMKDFPALAWFTTKIATPECLLKARLVGIHEETGDVIDLGSHPDFANAQALNRIAIGFRIADIPVIPWPDHAGYHTDEGKGLNDTARDVGDNPDDWYVSEVPVDLMSASEIWHSPSIFKPKMKRLDWYLADMKKMVTFCRRTPGVLIPPSWLKEEDAKKLAAQMGLAIANP